MLALKRLVTVLVMLYILLALLLIFSPGSRDGLMAITTGTNQVGFFYTLFLVGVVLLSLQLITENLDSTLLRRDVASRESKINELKARLYDQHLDQRSSATGAPRTGTTVHPEGYVVPTPPTPRRDDAPLA
jgi:hypothetical protein